MAMIFINYRRQDSQGTTFALREKLLKYFDDKEVFMDIEGLDAGEDFVDGLARTVSLADVMIVMIGRQWLDIRDSEGNKRLFKDDDFVRIEIASAISQGKKILPVLLDGTLMPDAADLPDDMKDLARRNAMELRLSRIDDDTRAIAEALKNLIPSKTITRKQMALTAAAALVIGILAGPFVNTWSGLDWGPDQSKIALGKAQERLESLRKDLEQTGADLEEAKATSKQYLQSYRKARGEILAGNRDSRKLEDRIRDKEIEISTLENRTRILCQNFQFTIKDTPASASNLIKFMMQGHCGEDP